MTLVVDASLIAGLLLPDEQGIAPELLAADELVAPWLLWAELRNILIVNERRGRLAPGLAEQMLDAVKALGIGLDTRPAEASVLQLARRHRLTIYDALYLELALRSGARLGTHDTALRVAAGQEAVGIVG
ncbi:type II toxin-antitoxin system VapC family toxin [Amaricoccus solimangrovi]|uniref:Ribonuclease VapC n=1 Tax=Amaricoccus solimangrovi TaxID=2589815 RepID=A0A501WCB2_9RHOB|nr:type II toxin-antitoxin system VapC family toxin [Amaricoccus solimangrovi]TPE45714.1 type II toxin-antitoxin system VapC family toxin [Amaricoccus solimangrovi]